MEREMLTAHEEAYRIFVLPWPFIYHVCHVIMSQQRRGCAVRKSASTRTKDPSKMWGLQCYISTMYAT